MTDDLISRQAAISALGEQGLITAMIVVDRVPSAEPDGRWEIIHPGETGYSAGDFRCSVCGQPNRCYHLTKYCCNCGARMVNRGKVKKRRRDEQGTNDKS